MRVEHLKRLPAFLVAALLLFSFSGIAYADFPTNRPYIKNFGGDVMAGGWYANGANCSTDPTIYQNQNFANSNLTPPLPIDKRTGGILAYANQSGGNARGGSSSQYGAFAFGTIDSNNATPGYGFYSAANVNPGQNVSTLSFANYNSLYFPPDWGGVFEGSVPQSHCIPDYYSKLPTKSVVDISSQSQPLSYAISQSNLNGTTDFKATAPAPNTPLDLTSGIASTIPAGKRITIYVSGDVYIDSNITYDSGADVDHVPKFALIVKGSIYIDKTVNELDGMYSAQPADNSANSIGKDDGIIWTCHPNNTDILPYTYPPKCTSPLVIKGAFIAKQISFYRVNGDIASASTSDDNLGTINNCLSGGCNVSEIVNYTPAMIMGGDFFTSDKPGGPNGLPIDSIVSLPPLF